MLCHGRFVIGMAADVKQTPVNHRVQRFHPPVEHFRKPRVLAQFNDLKARFPQHPGGPARRNQFNVSLRQSLGERNEARLVEHREERAAYLDHRLCPLTSPRRAAASIEESAGRGDCFLVNISVRVCILWLNPVTRVVDSGWLTASAAFRG